MHRDEFASLFELAKAVTTDESLESIPRRVEGRSIEAILAESCEFLRIPGVH